MSFILCELLGNLFLSFNWVCSRHLSWLIKTLLCHHFKGCGWVVSCCLDIDGLFVQSLLLGEKVVSGSSFTAHPYGYEFAHIFGCFSSLPWLGIWGQGVIGFEISMPFAKSPYRKFVWGHECPWLKHQLYVLMLIRWTQSATNHTHSFSHSIYLLLL